MNMMDLLSGAGLLCLVILPGVTVALVVALRSNVRLWERNAAQGQIIAGMEKRMGSWELPAQLPRWDDAGSIRAVERRLFGECPTCGAAESGGGNRARFESESG